MSLKAVSAVKGHLKELRRRGKARLLVNVASSSWRITKNISDALNIPQVLHTLASLEPDQSIDELVKIVMNGLGGALRPIQNPFELSRLLKLVLSFNPKTIVEVGTAKGGTLFLFARVCDPSGCLISVDLPGGLYGGGYPVWKTQLFRRFARGRQQIHLLRGDSHSKKMSDQVRRILNRGQIDLLFIDGDHSYLGVKEDFLNYKDLVRDGGLIVFHDILHNRFDPDIEVARFWDEIKSQYVTSEIVDDPGQGRFGIGVLHWQRGFRSA